MRAGSQHKRMVEVEIGQLRLVGGKRNTTYNSVRVYDKKQS